MGENDSDPVKATLSVTPKLSKAMIEYFDSGYAK